MMGNHVINDMIIVRGLRPRAYYRFQDNKEEPILVQREGQDVISIGISEVIRADIMCSNGIIHIVDRLMQRPY